MQITTIGDRFRVYTKSVGLLFLALAPVSLILFLPEYLVQPMGIIAIVWIITVLAYFPFHISRKLGLTSKPLLFGLPVGIIAYSLLAFKIFANVYTSRSCFGIDNPPLADSPEAMLKYLSFYCWTSILIWEIYLMIKTRQQSLI